MHNGMSSHIIYTEGGTGEGAFALELLNVKGGILVWATQGPSIKTWKGV